MTIVRIDEGRRYSQASVHGDTIYLAGQVGSPFDSMTNQARQVFAQIDDLLERVGSSRAHILRATILLADMADYAAMNEVWDEWFEGVSKPARATYGVGSANPRHAIEVVITAARKVTEKS